MLSWPAGQPGSAASATPISVGVPVVVTSPLPLSPLQNELDGVVVHSMTALSYWISIVCVNSPHWACGSTVVDIVTSGPVLVSSAPFWSPKPETETAAPTGYGAFGAGSATACTAGPLRSRGEASVRTAMSSGSPVSW